MEDNSKLKEELIALVAVATETQNYRKCLEKLFSLEESEDFERLLALALYEKEQHYCKVANSVPELVRRNSYCEFLGHVFLHASTNRKRHLNLQAFIMKLVLKWDCNVRDETVSVEDGLERDADCLSRLLPVLGNCLDESFPGLLNTLYANMREKVLSDAISRRAKSKLLDLLLLRAAGWQPIIDDTDNFAFSGISVGSGYGGTAQDDRISANQDAPRRVPFYPPVQEEGFASAVPLLPIQSAFDLDLKNKNDGFLLGPSHFDGSMTNIARSTLQKTPPRASDPPRPPVAWLLSNDYQKPLHVNASFASPEQKELSPPSTFCDYVAPLASYPNEERKSSPTTQISLASIGDFLKDQSFLNGARPKTKAEESATNVEISSNQVQKNERLPRKMKSPDGKSQDIVSTDRNKNSSWPSLSARTTQKKVPSPVTSAAELSDDKFQDGFKKDATTFWDNKLQTTSTNIGIKNNTPAVRNGKENNSDDEVIVEKDEKKGGKKKTKWNPLSTANVLNVAPSKASKVPEVRREINPADHPFLSSKRFCTICGAADHLTAACTKSAMSFMFQSD